MLTVMFFLLIVLVAYHFVYEGIVAPSLRLRLQFRLYALRDRLRTFKIEEPHAVSDSDFRLIEDGLNNAINLLSCISLSMLYQTRKAVRKKERWVREANQRVNRAEQCPHEGLRQIDKKATNILFEGLIINSGGWYIYVLPIVLVWYLWDQVMNFVKEVMSIPRPEVHRLIPKAKPVAT
jgi:hypothetical protein